MRLGTKRLAGPARPGAVSTCFCPLLPLGTEGPCYLALAWLFHVPFLLSHPNSSCTQLPLLRQTLPALPLKFLEGPSLPLLSSCRVTVTALSSRKPSCGSYLEVLV